MTAITIPPEIAALKPSAENVAQIDAWAKTLHPGIAITFDEYRAAPPRNPLRRDGEGRGMSIEELRAKDPGPPCLTVRVTELLTGQPTMRRVYLLDRQQPFATVVLARSEMAQLSAAQAERRKGHIPSDAELNSREQWEYEEELAAHHSLMGQLCQESVPDATYVANEQRLAELRDIVDGDWRASLAKALVGALHLAQNTERSARGRQKLIQLARERRSAASTATPG